MRMFAFFRRFPGEKTVSLLQKIHQSRVHSLQDNIEQLTPSERLRFAVHKSGGNQQVAEIAGIPLSTLNSYISGRSSMRIEAAARLAETCGVSLEWLIRGTSDADSAQTTDAIPNKAVPIAASETSGETISVPFLQSEASAGPGLEPVEWGKDQQVSVPIDFLKALIGFVPKQIFFMKVRGDSMNPTIHTGDTVIINYAQSPLRDGIYAISVNGMALIKRIGMKSPNTYSIISDNPFYERFDVPINDICWGSAKPDAQVRIIGRVIGHFHLENDAFLP